MAQNIRNLDISDTYPNILLLNANSLSGAPANLETPGKINAARVQDGLGNPTHLLISKGDIGVDGEPSSPLSVIRTVDLMESVAQAQLNSLIFS